MLNETSGEHHICHGPEIGNRTARALLDPEAADFTDADVSPVDGTQTPTLILSSPPFLLHTHTHTPPTSHASHLAHN